MKTKSRDLIIKFYLLVLFGISTVFAQTKNETYGVYDNDFPKPEVYKERRQRVLDKMEINSIAVIRSSDEKVRSGDVNFKYKQDGNFDYLTGCKESGSTLLLIPSGIEVDGKMTKEILFLKEKNPMSERWTGILLGTEGAKNVLGFDAALPNKEFKDYFRKTIKDKKILYLTFKNESLADQFSDKRYNLDTERKKMLQETYPGLEIKSIFSVIAAMRQIKSKDEIYLIQKAIDATTNGYIEAIKSCEAEMYEYQLQAIISYAFNRAGCEYEGFSSIVGSGPNSQVFHYESNRKQMKDGEVVVMDIGGEYHGYSADLTRTVPVNGKFSPAQKDIYNIVLKANEEVIKYIKPGVKSSELETIAQKVVGEGLLKLGIISNLTESRKFLPHGISHDIGLDVHDVGTYGPLRFGQIITIEPGIYIPVNSEGVDKKYWDIGIRIEDDVLITETGTNVLTKNAPKTVEEIEKIMAKKGIGNLEIGK